LLDRHHRPITEALATVQLAASRPDAADAESTMAMANIASITRPIGELRVINQC